MEGTDFRFDKTDRVRLRASVDPSFYGGYACVGNEGTIKDRRKDVYDLPQVFIEWDTNHWSYNGAPNCWTFEDHFDLVEKSKTVPDKEDKNAELLAKIAALFQETEDPDEGQTSDLPAEPERDVDKEYDMAKETATKLIDQCEGFFIVGVARRPTPEAERGMLVPVALGYSKSDEVELLTMSSASEYTARAHQELAINAIAELRERGNRE